MGRRWAPLLVLMALASAPAPAAASVIDVIRDCRDGTIDGDYSARELRQAERNLPSDQVEYGDCADALRQAQLDARRRSTGGGGDGGGSGGEAGSGGGSSGGGGSGGDGGGGEPNRAPGATPEVTPDEDVQALAQDKIKVGSGPPPSLPLGSGRVVPRASANSSVPLPLVLAMVAIGLLGLGAVWQMTRSRLGAPIAALRLRRR